MLILVRCRCDQWVMDHLKAPRRVYSAQCTVCERLTMWSFEHVGAFPDRNRFTTMEDVTWEHSLHTEDSSICVKQTGEIIDDYQTWYVEPNGRQIPEINGRVVTHDQFGVIEHIGEYEAGRCTRGLWMHQPSGFLYYRSRTSDIRYVRGVASGQRFHPLIEPNVEVATPTRYERMRNRLLRKFPFRSIKNRKCVELYWVPEYGSGTSSYDSSAR